MAPLIFIIAIFVAGASSELWFPRDVRDYLCSSKPIYDTPVPNEGVFETLRSLDRSKLSRLLAAYVQLNADKFKLPALTYEWEYDHKLLNLEERMRTYGLTIAKRDARGDNQCLFHSLRVGFIKHKYTIEILQRLMQSNLAPALRKAVMHMKTEGKYYSMRELKRLALVYQWGFDPEVKESMENFDDEVFLAKMQEYIDKRDALACLLGEAEGEKYRVDILPFKEEISNGNKNIKDVAAEIFKALHEAHSDLFGDSSDISALEGIFTFKVVVFNRTSRKITCVIKEDNRRVDFIVTLYCEDGKHFALQGIVDMYLPAEPYEPTGVMLASDIPLGLGIMIGDDCNL